MMQGQKNIKLYNGDVSAEKYKYRQGHVHKC